MSDPGSHNSRDSEISVALAKHGAWLRSVIAARLGGNAGASGVEDVLQEVHVAAIEQKSPLRDQSAVAPWLYQLAVRQVMQFRRRAGRDRKRLAAIAQDPAPKDDERADPLGWLLSTERKRLIRDALGDMSDADRDVLIRKYVDGWSYRQIAEHTQQTERAVESRLHRARQRLRARLAQMNVVDEDHRGDER